MERVTNRDATHLKAFRASLSHLFLDRNVADGVAAAAGLPDADAGPDGGVRFRWSARFGFRFATVDVFVAATAATC